MSVPTRGMSRVLVLCAVLLAAPSGGASEPARKLPTSDETAEALLTAMKTQDFAAAHDLFDAKMRAAVSEDKLKAVWDAQIATLGPLRSWATTQRTQAMGRDVRVAILKFEHGELQSTIAIDPQTQAVAGFGMRPVPPKTATTPAPYVDVSRFHAVDMSVGTAPFVLAGTLTLPIQLDPVPGVILVHGSGPQDRDETIGANKVFKDLAEGLSSRGIAVLRYDKRTYQYGAKLSDSMSVDDEVMVDAVAAVNALRSRPEVNPQRVFVIGHSMGALLAPEIAARSGSVAGVALLAPPGRAPWDIVISQVHYLEAPKAEVADIEEKVKRLKSGTLGTERLLGAPQSYWKDLAARDGIGMAKKLGTPILILRGDRDYQVIEDDVEAWRKGLAGVPNVEIVTIPGLNHLFIPGTGKPGPAEYNTPGHVDARVIEKLAAFIGK